MARVGQTVLELCDAHITSLRFCCRAGSCGTCLVRVLEGMDNLSAPTSNETILLSELTTDSRARLACQIQVLGPVSLTPF